MEASVNWRELVAVGQVARAQGRKGEVAVNPMTDFPDRFHKLSRVFTATDDGTVVPLSVEWVREQGGRPILKFQGVSDIGEAERLAGRELRIPEAELTALPEGSYYHFWVRGCTVWDARLGRLGVVEEVLRTGGTDLLVVRNSAGEELLIPLCGEICRSIDTEKHRIEVETPEGLVALNAD
jgi:16S rRNA processing protein RimM